MRSVFQDRARNLLREARENGWAGWDPFDALASPVLRRLSFSSRLLRTAWIQLFKRSSLNLRPLARVPKLRNPKALALFASALSEPGFDAGPGQAETRNELLDTLLRLLAPGVRGAAWGYPFDWQSRAFFAPRGTPNVIVTVFCGHAFLDAFTATGRADRLAVAREACEFITSSLQRTRRGDSFAFSYTPGDRSVIHNANLLAASLLCRTGEAVEEPGLVKTGVEAALYSVRAQKADGSWDYGEASNQRWVDSFHTGYDLIALDLVFRHSRRAEFSKPLESGYAFYRSRFFSPEGRPSYFPDGGGPVDIHSAATGILAFSKLSPAFPEARRRAEEILLWTLSRMSRPRGSGFLYRTGGRIEHRVPYLRWADAWMARAIAAYLSLQPSETSHDTVLPSRLSR